MIKATRDYRRLFKDLGMGNFEFARLLGNLREGFVPRYILETVLQNPVPSIKSGFFSTEYALAFIESVGRGLVRDKVDLIVVMSDAIKYAEDKGGIPENMSLADGYRTAVSRLFMDFFKIKHMKDLERDKLTVEADAIMEDILDPGDTYTKYFSKTFRTRYLFSNN